MAALNPFKLQQHASLMMRQLLYELLARATSSFDEVDSKWRLGSESGC